MSVMGKSAFPETLKIFFFFPRGSLSATSQTIVWARKFS